MMVDSLFVILICSSFFISTGFVFLYKKMAISHAILARPNHRTLHKFPIPKGGGVVFSLLFFIFMWNMSGIPYQLFFLLGVGGFAATLFGFIDDMINISPVPKLIIQLFLSVWAVYWLYIDGLLLLDFLPIFLIIPACLFLMIWMINAYNFMDGIDGMASSGAIFISLTLALSLFLTNGNILYFYIFIFLSASIGGFIIFNWPPASIFMGDAGSVFLGYIFGSLLLVTVLNNDISIWIWLTVFGYFFSDTVVTQIMRVVLVKKWYLAHRSHAYQNITRITGSHLKVTNGVALYNIIWILPLTIWSSLYSNMGMIAALLAISPALFVSYKYGPVFSSS